MAAEWRRARSPNLTGTVHVVAPLLQLLTPSDAVAVAEAAADRLPPTPARVRLLLAASARCGRYPAIRCKETCRHLHTAQPFLAPRAVSACDFAYHSTAARLLGLLMCMAV